MHSCAERAHIARLPISAPAPPSAALAEPQVKTAAVDVNARVLSQFLGMHATATTSLANSSLPVQATAAVHDVAAELVPGTSPDAPLMEVAETDVATFEDERVMFQLTELAVVDEEEALVLSVLVAHGVFESASLGGSIAAPVAEAEGDVFTLVNPSAGSLVLMPTAHISAGSSLGIKGDPDESTEMSASMRKMRLRFLFRTAKAHEVSGYRYHARPSVDGIFAG